MYLAEGRAGRGLADHFAEAIDEPETARPGAADAEPPLRWPAEVHPAAVLFLHPRDVGHGKTRRYQFLGRIDRPLSSRAGEGQGVDHRVERGGGAGLAPALGDQLRVV